MLLYLNLIRVYCIQKLQILLENIKEYENTFLSILCVPSRRRLLKKISKIIYLV